MKLGYLVNPRTLGARPCWRKERHPSRGKAEAALRSLLKRLEGCKAPAQLNVYQCPHCRMWHTGHGQEPDART